MKCLFVDYYRPNEKIWHKRWEDLAVSGEIVDTDGLDAKLDKEGASITLVVMHAVDDAAYTTVRDKVKSLTAKGCRFFFMRVAAGGLERSEISSDCLRYRSVVPFATGGTLIELKSRFTTLVDALSHERQASDWGATAWCERIKTIWNEWETGTSAKQKSSEVAGDDWTVAATLRILSEGFNTARSFNQTTPSAFNARREAAVRTRAYWLGPFQGVNAAPSSNPTTLITKIAGSFGDSTVVAKAIQVLTAEPVDKQKQDAAVTELVTWLKARYRLL